MFSLFKKKVSIHAVSFVDLGWSKIRDDASVTQWINSQQTISISRNYFDIVPDIPTITDVNRLRAFYRNLLVKNNGGLIEVSIMEHQGIPFVRTIFKLQTDRGMSYIGSITIPFSDCSFVLKVYSEETGMTGMREASVANQLLSAGNLDFNQSEWSADPYEPEFKEGILMNKSESVDFDTSFPDHPLSQARHLLRKIEKSLNFGKELKTLRPFGQ